MSRDWAGWNMSNLGKVGNWGLRGIERESPLPPFFINDCVLILLCSLLLHVVLPPLFLSPLSLPLPFFSSITSFHYGLCLDIGLDINSHQRGDLPKGEERKVLSVPGFGENPPGEGPSGQEFPPRKRSVDSPQVWVPGPWERGRVKLKSESPTTYHGESRLRLCWRERILVLWGSDQKREGAGFTWDSSTEGLMLCNFSGWPRLLKTAEAQLIKYIFTVEIIWLMIMRTPCETYFMIV